MIILSKKISERNGKRKKLNLSACDAITTSYIIISCLQDDAGADGVMSVTVMVPSSLKIKSMDASKNNTERKPRCMSRIPFFVVACTTKLQIYTCPWCKWCVRECGRAFGGDIAIEVKMMFWRDKKRHICTTIHDHQLNTQNTHTRRVM